METINQKAVDKISKAKIILLQFFPFYAMVAMRLKTVINPNIPRARTNGKCIEYNPEYVMSLPIAQLAGLVAHEVLHVVLLHHLRMDMSKYELDTWNRAGDYKINYMIIKIGMELPDNILYDKKYDETWSSEDIYNDLKKKKEEEQENGSKEEDNSSTDDSEDNNEGKEENEGSNDTEEGGDEEEGNSSTDGDGEEGEETQSEASGNSGSEASNEDNDWDIGGCVQATDSAVEAEALEEEVKEMIHEAIQVSKKKGLPYGVEREVDEIMQPKVDWKVALHDFIIPAKDDYSYRKPNIKNLYSGFIMPGLYSEKIGKTVLLADTSGSIDRVVLTQVGSEISFITANSGHELNVGYVDDALRGTQTFQPGDDVKLEPKGDGCTDFIPGFDYATSIDPECCIYFTDGICDSFPDKEPAYRTLWVIHGRNERIWGKFKPPFGEVIVIK